MAPLHQGSSDTSGPIRDAQGRIHYIVELYDAAAPRLPGRTPAGLGPASDAALQAHHQLMEEMGAEHQFVPTTTTRLIGKSFSAFLTSRQVERLRRDSRVERISEDSRIELSAAWTNTGSTEVASWGLNAVGGWRSSYGTRKVYVLDSGVDFHGDLNVVERIPAMDGIPVASCYRHATHVAGIIGARANAQGVLGVHAGVPIVSVAVASNQSLSPCIPDVQATTVYQGLERIRERLIASRVVGIVNISMNSPDYRLGLLLGNKLKSMALPDPSQGYPGAFIVQSAGNGHQDACLVSYNDPKPDDGIMVVGALDDNGQPVKPLNGSLRFQNMPYAKNEPGSNFGPCVEAWAPGNVIRSTWSGGGYINLSGTSMAAPHVTGLASVLAESQGLTSPVQIEQAVRAKLVSLPGSAAVLPGSTGVMPNLNGQGAFAQPTVAFSSSYFEGPDSEVRTLKYDSVGATSCNLRVLKNGAYWYQLPNLPPAYTVLNGTLPAGQYQWTVDCTTAQGVRASAVASATIRRLAWLINTTSTGYVWREFTGPAHESTTTFTWSAGAPMYQRYESVGFDACEVTSSGVSRKDFYWETTKLWSSGVYPPSLDFGVFYMDNPLTAAPPYGPFDKYKWQVECWNSAGTRMSATVYGTQSY
ncbi:S8 family serine peptidase [Archangium gephyra]|uniref:S8 family peptidase n=1 Tax=Archangium gephyra TaxID=48 RepID=UPI0035D4DEA4